MRSFKQIVDLAQHLACGLSEAGLKQSEYALLLAPNGPEWITPSLALLSAGVVPVPALDARERSH